MSCPALNVAVAMLAAWCPPIMVRLSCRAKIGVAGLNFMPSGSFAEGTEPLSSGLGSQVALCRVLRRRIVASSKCRDNSMLSGKSDRRLAPT